MAKVLRRGTVLPEGDIPPGVLFHCYSCGSELETEADERGIPELKEEHGIRTPGWLVICPVCHSTIFIAQGEAEKQAQKRARYSSPYNM